MPDAAYRESADYSDDEALRSTLSAGMVDWDFDRDPTVPLAVRLALRHAGGLRALSVSGNPIRVMRGRPQIARDQAAFLGVLFQRSGHTVCEQPGRRMVAAPGDIVIWHSQRPIDFNMPDRFHKLCMLVPIEAIESVLPDAESYEGLHLKGEAHVTTLLGACLTALADDVFMRGEEPTAPAVDFALEMLGMAITASGQGGEAGARTSLFERITKDIDRRLDEPGLKPAGIAQRHGISVRYLHLLFSERGATVGEWVRSRRLSRCRAELSDQRADRTLTEIAYAWGFSDAAHFSRLFKSAYGTSPGAFRRARAG